MAEVITDDELRELAETCTYDNYADFVLNKREYATQMGFHMPTSTDKEKTRAKDIMAQLQAVRTPGVPNGF